MNEQYKIIKTGHFNIAKAVEMLEVMVNDSISDGYTPQGGAAFGQSDEIMREGRIAPFFTVIQTMIYRNKT